MTNAEQRREALGIQLFALREKRERLDGQFLRAMYEAGADRMKVRGRFVPLLREVNAQIIELDSRLARMTLGLPE